MSLQLYWYVTFSIMYQFFKKILLTSSSPLSRIKYYMIRIEFQVKSPPYVLSFLKVLNQPVISESTMGSFIEYLDSVVCANLPYKEQDLFNIFNPIQDDGGQKGTLPTKFFPATSTKVEISLQNFQTFSFNPFSTLL